MESDHDVLASSVSKLWIMELVVRQLEPDRRNGIAFADDQRFEHNDDWWKSEELFKRPSVQFGTRANYSFLVENEEIARALVCADRSPLGGYSLPRRAQTVHEIQFIEVRPDLRGQGWGVRVVDSLRPLHPGWLTALALPQAEGFWSRTGWQRVLPDGDDGRSTAFVVFT